MIRRTNTSGGAQTKLVLATACAQQTCAESHMWANMACQDKEKSNNKLPRQYARARTHAHTCAVLMHKHPPDITLYITRTNNRRGHASLFSCAVETPCKCDPTSVVQCDQMWASVGGWSAERAVRWRWGRTLSLSLFNLSAGLRSFPVSNLQPVVSKLWIFKNVFFYNGSQTELETEMCYQYTAGPTQLGVTD